MFSWFKKSKQPKAAPLLMEDMQGNLLEIGDLVEVQRYELGLCTIEDRGGEWHYKSIEKGESVSYVKMIDAHSKRQKVIKKLR
jgi:hypothetical protein